MSEHPRIGVEYVVDEATSADVRADSLVPIGYSGDGSLLVQGFVEDRTAPLDTTPWSESNLTEYVENGVLIPQDE